MVLRHLRRVAVLQCVLLAVAEPPIVPAVNFEYSPDSDLFNQEKALQYFEKRYYNDENLWSLSDQHLQEADVLRQAALVEPALALAAAQVLYLFAWFRRSGEIVRENVVAAADLFERSISVGGCAATQPSEVWVQSACDIRVGQTAILYNWLGETEGNVEQGRLYRSRAAEMLEFIKQVPRYAEVSHSWSSPMQINFNQLRFPGVPSRPFWDASRVPLATFLEEHFETFRAELEALVFHPADLFEQLRRADGSVESLATPGGWDAVRIVRYGNWFEPFCELAPQTCALLRSRAELVNCPYVNTNYYKLHPGSHLKPHFGNAPRLTVHLPVIAPEPLRAGISVGPEMSLWTEGKVIVLDDTYPHSVSHWGTKPRFVLASWFCHPCDEDHEHGQTCPTAI